MAGVALLRGVCGVGGVSPWSVCWRGVFEGRSPEKIPQDFPKTPRPIGGGKFFAKKILVVILGFIKK